MFRGVSREGVPYIFIKKPRFFILFLVKQLQICLIQNARYNLKVCLLVPWRDTKNFIAVLVLICMRKNLNLVQIDIPGFLFEFICLYLQILIVLDRFYKMHIQRG